MKAFVSLAILLSAANAFACPTFYPSKTTFETALEKAKERLENNGITISECFPLAKDVVEPNAKDVIQFGSTPHEVWGVKTTSVYRCKSDKKGDIAFKIYRFTPLEKPNQGFGTMALANCTNRPSRSFVAEETSFID